MGSLSILYADDDEDDCLIFREILADLQFTGKVAIVNDGKQAMVKVNLGTNHITHFFLDINMPYKNGIECLDEIRLMEIYKVTPIIMLTSEVDQKSIDKCFKKGASRYMVKPNSFLKFKVMMNTILTTDSENFREHVKTNFLIS